ncbi:MAG: DUF4062 domain-containing protein [Anaerolineae bacterium]
MTTRDKAFRIFVSSTFRDLTAERNILQKVVFPRLRDLCTKHGARFQAIDLRWGVSEEASLDQQTMNICLSEIERCQQITPRPNFIVLLGDRYGWCPPPPQVPAAEYERILTAVPDPGDRALLLEWYARDDNAVPAEYYLLPRTGAMAAYGRWAPVERRLQRTLAESARRLGLAPDLLTKYATSATEQEIVRGAMGIQDAQQHIFGFFRAIEGLPEDRRAGEFVDLDPAGRRDAGAASRLCDLKRRLGEQLPDNVHHYTAQWTGEGITLDHLDRLAEDVYRCLSRVILEEIERPSLPLPLVSAAHSLAPHQSLDEEGLAHYSFAHERLTIFVGRTSGLAEVRDYLVGKERAVLGVVGQGGTGKSSLMAKAIEGAHRDHPTTQIVYRFLGTTPDSSTIPSLLASLCRELDRRHGVDDGRVPGDYHELVTEFISRLGRATAARPLIIFLDALDQLSPHRAARRLAWLPDPLPDHVRIVLSARSDAVEGSWEQRAARRVVLGPMSAVEGDVLLTKWLEGAKRTLQEPQRRLVLAQFNNSGGRPLYLRLAFEEARRWKSGAGEPPEQLAPGIPGIIRHNLLGRLAREDTHGETLVSHVLGYLAASRYGLAEDELLDLLSRDPEVYAWFLRSVFHHPQDIVTATRDYLHDHGRLAPSREGESVGDEEAAARRWLADASSSTEELGAFLTAVLAKPDGPRLPVVLWSRLYFDLQPFLSNPQAGGTALLGFFHRELGEVAAERYLAGDQEAKYHVRLAAYFRARSDPTGTGRWDGNAPRGLSELPYHLAQGACWDEVSETLADLQFLGAKTMVLGPQALIDDYDHVERAGLGDPSLQAIREALQLSAHVLVDDPSQAAGQLTGRLLWSDLPLVHRLLDGARSWDRPWLRPLTGALIRPGDQLLRTLVGHRGPVDHVAFAPDGKHVISKSGDGTARIWDPATGDALRVVTDEAAVQRLWLNTERHGLIEQDPTHRFSISQEHEVLHVRREDDRAPEVMLVGHNHDIRTWAFSPDGTRLVTGGEDHTVRVWDLAGRRDEQVLEHPGGVTAVAAVPDGSLAVSGGVDGMLRVWDLRTGTEMRALAGHRDRISALAITGDGQRVLSASNDGTLKLWDLSGGAELLSLSGHPGGVRALAVTADGQHALSAGADRTLRAWNLVSGRQRAAVEGPQAWQPAIALSPNGRLAAAAYRDRTVRVWDLDTSALTATCIGHMNTIHAVSFSPSGMHLVSGGDDQTLRIWETDTGIEQATLLGHWDVVRALAFARHDRLLSLARDDTLRLWDPHSGRELFRLGGREVDPSRRSQSPSASRTGAAPTEPLGLSTGRDGQQAVSFYINDDTLRVWDLKRGALAAAFTGDFVLSCCALADGAVIAGTRNGRVYLLRLDGSWEIPVSSTPPQEAEAPAKPVGPPGAWRVEDAGAEREALIDAGVLSASSLRSSSVYRLVHRPAEHLGPTDVVTLRGSLTCPCGQETALEASIAFGGFLSALSKVPVFCPRCSRDMLLVGETSRAGGREGYWLLVMTTTGPPGVVEMPGTASGRPELQVDTVEPPP